MAQEKRNLAIWKIDADNVSFQGLKRNDIIRTIVSEFNSRQNDVSRLTPVSLSRDLSYSKNLQLFYRKRISQTWKYFTNPILDIDEEEERGIFQSINKDFILFIYDEEDVFVLTSGSGFYVIQEYIDKTFPLEVSKKVFKGEFKNSEIRDLVGEVYSKTENYRRSYSYSRSEAFGKIWKKLYGQIDPEVIRNSPLSLVLDPQKKINAQMKSSFTFRKSVTIDEIIKLIEALQELPPLDSAREERFRYLDTLSEVKSKRDKDSLEDILLRVFFDALNSGDFAPTDGFDFCHPENIVEFLGGCEYSVNDNSMGIEDAPKASEVLEFLRNNNLINYNEGFDEFKRAFSRIYFSFKASEDEFPISSKIIKYFHGEVLWNKKTYFYVDGSWYEPIGSFFDYLLEDVVIKLFDEHILQDAIPFQVWGDFDEEQFNLNHKNQDGFYFGDKHFLQAGLGRVELFDLLYIDGEKLYIIQTKKGFDAAIRDAASQLEFSADIIEEAKSGEAKNLEDYYKRWNNNEKNKINLEDFISLFQNSTRIYVLACAPNRPMTRDNFNNNVFQSKIAQFEILALCHSFNAKGRNFMVVPITKT